MSFLFSVYAMHALHFAFYKILIYILDNKLVIYKL